jgi:hypothetical protein
MADYGDRKVDWQKVDKYVARKGKDGIVRKHPYQSRSSAGKDRREDFVRLLVENDGSVAKTLQQMDWGKAAYMKMRARWPEFAAKVDAARGLDVSDGFTYSGDFGLFRLEFFGFDTPWFHRLIVNFLEGDEKQGGSITLVLLPPEHGKTTLLEDYDCFKLAMDPNFSITVGSERQEMARKVLRRVRFRMEEGGPAPEFVGRFGPFAPQKGIQNFRGAQPWGADFFDVFKKRDHDEREYSMQALGANSQIAGTRADLLQADDITSLKNYNQTEGLVEKFRQDWLSRPGTTGRTVIVGTRVGEMDFYETLETEGIIDHLVKLPAINDDGEYLWPERYSPADYERMRRNVGEDAWWRNYMQKPKAAGDATFTEEALEKSCRPWLTLDNIVLPEWPIYIGIDPALGGVCAISAWQHAANELRLVAARTITNLSRAEQIMQELEAMVLMLRDPERQVRVTDVIIETNAFQKGLANDERLVELSDRHNFNIMPHVTGKNKHDELIGLAQMERSMRQGQIVLPFGDDDRTRAIVEPLLQEMRSWRPEKRGNRLRQDRLMSMWFVWILWRNRLGHRHDVDQSSHKIEPIPSLLLGSYKPLTTGYRPLI